MRLHDFKDCLLVVESFVILDVLRAVAVAQTSDALYVLFNFCVSLAGFTSCLGSWPDCLGFWLYCPESWLYYLTRILLLHLDFSDTMEKPSHIDKSREKERHSEDLRTLFFHLQRNLPSQGELGSTSRRPPE